MNLSPIPEGVRSGLLGWASAMDISTSSGPASWGQANANGKVTKVLIGAACNASIQSAAYIVGLRPYKPTALAKRWFEWLVDRSPYAPYIVADDQTLLLTGELPANLLVACLIMQRQPREHPQVVEFMFKMVDDYGCPEDLAFLIAFSVSYSDKSVNVNHYPIAPASGAGMSYWENFLGRRPAKLNGKFVDGASYTGVFALWGAGTTYGSDNAFFEEMKKVAAIKTEGVKVVVPNPFLPVVKKSGGSSKYSTANALDLVPGLINHFYPSEKALAA